VNDSGQLSQSGTFRSRLESEMPLYKVTCSPTPLYEIEIIKIITREKEMLSWLGKTKLFSLIEFIEKHQKERHFSTRNKCHKFQML
jgi:hypothetical protein